MTPTPEQWELAKIHIDVAHEMMKRVQPAHTRIVLAHLDIARQALNPVTDEERAG